MRLRRIAETCCAKQGIQPGQLTLHADRGGTMRSKEDGRAFGQGFFRWYNNDHHHSGLGFLTPAIMHVGQAATAGGSPFAPGRRMSGRAPTSY